MVAFYAETMVGIFTEVFQRALACQLAGTDEGAGEESSKNGEIERVSTTVPIDDATSVSSTAQAKRAGRPNGEQILRRGQIFSRQSCYRYSRMVPEWRTAL